MADNNTALTNITDLSRLIRVQQPLEVLDTERSQEDNGDVMDFVNAFLDIIDQELSVPRLYKEYAFGKKEPFVRSQMISRLELVVSRIMEKRAMECSTDDLDERKFIQEELNFFIDLYYLLVTCLIDLSSIRKKDLDPDGAYYELFDVIKAHMQFIGAYPELDVLVKELTKRKDDYPELPVLESKINELLAYSPVKEGDFLFEPTRSISDYVTGDLLVSIHPDSDVQSLSLGDLPSGLIIDEVNGRISVQDPALLKAGNYQVFVQSKDEKGGITKHNLVIPIGNDKVPKYEVSPYRIIEDYLRGDVLAKPVIEDNALPIAKAEWIESSREVPNGVLLDVGSGVIKVDDEDLLEIGSYPVSVKLTNQQGTESQHRFILSFKQDREAVYTFAPSKLIEELKQGDTIATVSDEDGDIIRAAGNTLPQGMEITKNGSIIVQDSASLKAGTHLFNVLTQNELGVEAVKTLFIKLNAAVNPFYYDTSGVKPIGELIKGDDIAVIVNDAGIIFSKARLVYGDLPSGTTFVENGSIRVSDPTKLETGNFDLRVKVFVDGEGASEIGNLEKSLAGMLTALAYTQQQLIQVQSVRNEKAAALGGFMAQLQFDIQEIQRRIENIQKLMEAATNDEELADLQAQLDAELLALQTLVEEGQDQYAEMLSEIETLDAQIVELESSITARQSEIDLQNEKILLAKSKLWIEYDLSVLLTLEEDGPSAWHMEIPKDWDEFDNHEILAQLMDCDGYGSVEIISGKLPAGLELNEANGTISVKDYRELRAGEYELTTLSTDQQNGTTKHRLVLIIGGETTGVNEEYIILPSKPINNYVPQEIVGYPYNTLYTVVSARVSQGILPDGLAINETSGEIIVSDPDLLKEGDYVGIEIKTVNSSGGSNYHRVRFSFSPKAEFTVVVNPRKPITEYKRNDKLVKVKVQGGPLQGVKVVGGELAPGTALNSAKGIIFVQSPNKLEAGDYQVEMYMLAKDGAEDQQEIDFSLGIQEEFPKLDLIVEAPRYFHVIENGDTLSEFIPHSEIESASLTDGELPIGSVLSDETGRIYVSDRTILSRVSKMAYIGLVSRAGSQKAFTVSISNKLIPELSVIVNNFDFLDEFSARLVDYQVEYLNDRDVRVLVDPFYITIRDFAIQLEGQLANRNVNRNYINGNREGYIRDRYEELAPALTAEIEATTDENVRRALFKLYNEFLVSILALSAYRNEDISGRVDNPTRLMFEMITRDMNTRMAEEETQFLRENITLMADKVSPLYKILRAEFVQLGS